MGTLLHFNSTDWLSHSVLGWHGSGPFHLHRVKVRQEDDVRVSHTWLCWFPGWSREEGGPESGWGTEMKYVTFTFSLSLLEFGVFWKKCCTFLITVNYPTGTFKVISKNTHFPIISRLIICLNILNQNVTQLRTLSYYYCGKSDQNLPKLHCFYKIICRRWS
jgi:hypothetical protein